MLLKVWKDKKDDPNRPQRLDTEGVEIDKTYTENELARGNEVAFTVSGVTKGELLDGVRFIPNGAIVNSICNWASKWNF